MDSPSNNTTTDPVSHQGDNSNSKQPHFTPAMQNSTTNSERTKKTVKVVKVTRVTTTKTLNTSELQAAHSKIKRPPDNNNEAQSEPALKDTSGWDNHPPETPEPLRRASTTTLTTVISPRQSAQDVKPKRVLKVRTTSLTGESPANYVTTTPNNRRLSTGSNNSNASDKSSKLQVNGEDNPINKTPKSSPRISHTSQPSCESTKSDTSVKSQSATANQRGKITTALRAPISEFMPIEPASTVHNSNTTQNHSSPNSDSTPAAVLSPSSDISQTSLLSNGGSYDTSLSPRSDISNLATPRSFISSPRMPVSSILELDIPETSIDGGVSHAQPSWEESSPQTPGGGETDKVSCTTDESGFTSGSSDSDITLAAPGML